MDGFSSAVKNGCQLKILHSTKMLYNYSFHNIINILVRMNTSNSFLRWTEDLVTSKVSI